MAHILFAGGLAGGLASLAFFLIVGRKRPTIIKVGRRSNPVAIVLLVIVVMGWAAVIVAYFAGFSA